MSRYQLRLLLSSLTAIGLICVSAFVMHWFTASIPALGSGEVLFSLRDARACQPAGCAVVPLSTMKGAYPALASFAFWCSIPLVLAVVVQCGMKVVSGMALELVSKVGYAFGAAVFLSAFAAGYLFHPEGMGFGRNALIELVVDRTPAPLLLLLGSLIAMIALRYAITEASVDDDAGEYKPIVVAKDRDGRLPVTPLSSKVITPLDGSPPLRGRLPDSLSVDGPARPRTPTSPPSDAGRPKSPSSQPLVARTSSPGHDFTRSKSPSQPNIARTNSPGHDPARSKSPSQPNVARLDDPRAKSPSSQPLIARTSSPSNLDADIARSRTSSSGPIDLAARLAAAPLEVAIRQPPPEPERVPADQIPVAPESGLTIRKRTVSAGPLATESIPVAPESGLTIRKKSPSQMPIAGLPSSAPNLMMPGLPSTAPWVPPATDMPSIDVGSFVDVASPVPSAAHSGTIRFAVAKLALTSAGLDAKRDDGSTRVVSWNAIVGVVARRFPPTTPYDGATFVDVVSTAGSTLRILASTEITGHALDRSTEVRARELVNLIAAQCLDAKLDAATKKFANGGSAAQLPDSTTLAIHDQRLA